MDKSEKNPSSAEDFFRVSYERKTHRAFFNFRLLKKIRAVRDLQRVRSAKFPAQDFFRVSYHRHSMQSISRRCSHKESQSAFIPFITSERMRYESLRTDERETHRAFFNFRLLKKIRAAVVRGSFSISFPRDSHGARLRFAELTAGTCDAFSAVHTERYVESSLFETRSK